MFPGNLLSSSSGLMMEGAGYCKTWKVLNYIQKIVSNSGLFVVGEKRK
jgi:hypothetical protein